MKRVNYKPIKGYNKIMINHPVSRLLNGMAATSGIDTIDRIIVFYDNVVSKKLSYKRFNK